MKFIKTLLLSLFAVSLLSVSSCKKSEGEGGKASIIGKIWVKRYNEIGIPMPLPEGEYPGAYEDVYIIYGDDATYGDKVQANFDGVYEFKYLRTGSYKIYSYSSGTSITTANRVAITKDVEISEKKQTVECETIEIAK
ncbi:MAG TPA: hypothetical protein VJI69_05495 [Bacteroidia bacterium]|nr:hypothetical protein [Bacteroidia bacterium]